MIYSTNCDTDYLIAILENDDVSVCESCVVCRLWLMISWCAQQTDVTLSFPVQKRVLKMVNNIFMIYIKKKCVNFHVSSYISILKISFENRPSENSACKLINKYYIFIFIEIFYYF